MDDFGLTGASFRDYGLQARIWSPPLQDQQRAHRALDARAPAVRLGRTLEARHERNPAGRRHSVAGPAAHCQRRRTIRALQGTLSEFDVTKSPQEQGWNGPTLPWEAEPYQKLKLYKHITDSDGDVEAIEVSAIDPEDNMTIGVIAQKQIDSARHGDLLDNGFNVEIGSVEFGEAGPDDDIIAALSQPYGPDDWIREAEDLLQLGGESVWTDSDGTEFVCNVRQETAIEQRCLIDRHQCDIAALMCGNINFRGGERNILCLSARRTE